MAWLNTVLSSFFTSSCCFSLLRPGHQRSCSAARSMAVCSSTLGETSWRRQSKRSLTGGLFWCVTQWCLVLLCWPAEGQTILYLLTEEDHTQTHNNDNIVIISPDPGWTDYTDRVRVLPALLMWIGKLFKMYISQSPEAQSDVFKCFALSKTQKYCVKYHRAAETKRLELRV